MIRNPAPPPPGPASAHRARWSSTARWGSTWLSLVGLAAASCSATPPARIAPVFVAVTSVEPSIDGTMPHAALPPVARDVRFSVVAADADSADVELLVRTGLLRAGYFVVDPGSESDAEIRVASQDASASDPADPEGGTGGARISLQLIREAAVVHWLVMPLAREEQRPEGVRELVDRLSTSPPLLELATLVRATRPRDDARIARGTSSRVETASEDVGFSSAAARRCRNNRSDEACGRLARYVAEFPNGTHAATAKAVLELARYTEPAKP